MVKMPSKDKSYKDNPVRLFLRRFPDQLRKEYPSAQWSLTYNGFRGQYSEFTMDVSAWREELRISAYWLSGTYEIERYEDGMILRHRKDGRLAAIPFPEFIDAFLNHYIIKYADPDCFSHMLDFVRDCSKLRELLRLLDGTTESFSVAVRRIYGVSEIPEA
jgi:hypothetical protein